MIYLHFYAATSMETCARPLFSTSPYRAQLIKDARSHYDRAAELIQKAEDSVSFRTRPSSVASMTSTDSIRSPAGSVSSRAWTSETGISSPTQSIASIEDLMAQRTKRMSPPLTPASKKKVSFYIPAHRVPSSPFIRPDSPTLGFEDSYFAAGRARPVLPEPPTPPIEETQQEDDDVTPRASDRPAAPRNPYDDVQDHLKEPTLTTASANRYIQQLESLKEQLHHHRANLDALLEDRSLDLGLASGRTTPASMTDSSADDEMRTLDRKARIERLRASGWQRKRFDFRRYENLRSTALAELS
jgi:hypothetical protein